MKGTLLSCLLVLSALESGARATDSADTVDNDVVTTAEDAFGLTIGPESLGLYSENQVRGFSPLSAGNARLDGLYFDKQGLLPETLFADERIRVGMSALGFPFPAPTGIVDFELRRPGEKAGLTSMLTAGPFGTREAQANGQLPSANGRFGLTGGLLYRADESFPGVTQRIREFSVMPQWTPSKDVELRMFWSRRDLGDAKILPTVYPVQELPRPFDRHNFGQDWARETSYVEHYGVFIKAPLAGWTWRAGVFHSLNNVEQSYADLYVDAQSDGGARHFIVAESAQRAGSTSGETEISRVWVSGPWEQSVVFSLRGRDVNALYGGTDQVDLGMARVGIVMPVARPGFTVGPRSIDRIHQVSGGGAYTLRKSRLFEVSAGIQKTSYRREIDDPTGQITRRNDAPWLGNASATVTVTPKLTLFSAYTRGLEDSGTAPSEAINRGEILEAVRTRQVEVGAGYVVTPSLKFAATAFDVTKPYFGIGEDARFERLGSERHRGMEFSLTGDLVSGLKLVAGSYVMSPEVAAVSAPPGEVGRKPIGQSSVLYAVDVDYRLAWWPRLSFDAHWVGSGAQAASLDNKVRVGASTAVDLGARYRFSVGRAPATLRVQVVNVTDEFSWYVGSDGGLQPVEPRRATAYVIVDL